MTVEAGGGEAPRSLADKINRLFAVMHKAGDRPATNEDVAAAINATGRTTISPSYLYLLRSGKRDNPTRAHLQAIADYFQVSPGYFFDADVAAETDAELDLLVSLRDAGVKSLALRATGLSPQALRSIALMVEQARNVERLPPIEEDGEPGTGGLSPSHPGGRG